MVSTAHPHTLAGRVNEQQLAKVDAACRLVGQMRAHFTVRATLERADEVLRDAVGQDSKPEASGS